MRIYQLFDYMRSFGFTIEDPADDIRFLEKMATRNKSKEQFMIEHYHYTKGETRISIIRNIDKCECFPHDYWEIYDLSPENQNDVERFTNFEQLQDILYKYYWVL